MDGTHHTPLPIHYLLQVAMNGAEPIRPATLLAFDTAFRPCGWVGFGGVAWRAGEGVMWGGVGFDGVTGVGLDGVVQWG